MAHLLRDTMLCVCLLLVSSIQLVLGTQDAVGPIGEMMGRMPVQVMPDTSTADAAGEIIKGLASIPPPGAVLAEKLDPVSPGEASCDRDLDEICPEGWVNLGAIKGGSTEYCHGGSQYFGPCADEIQAFAGMSSHAKKRWSEGCKAYFPCRRCQRDFGQACPAGWTKLGNSRKCSPPKTGYSGPCRNDANFEGYNTAMLEAWSETCGAYWSCAPARDFEKLLSSGFPSSGERLS